MMLDPSPFSCQTFEELISQKELLSAQLDRVQDALREVSRQPLMSPRRSDMSSNTTPRLFDTQQNQVSAAQAVFTSTVSTEATNEVQLFQAPLAQQQQVQQIPQLGKQQPHFSAPQQPQAARAKAPPVPALAANLQALQIAQSGAQQQAYAAEPQRVPTSSSQDSSFTYQSLNQSVHDGIASERSSEFQLPPRQPQQQQVPQQEEGTSRSEPVERYVS